MVYNAEDSQHSFILAGRAAEDALLASTCTCTEYDSHLKQGSRISESNQPKSAWICGCGSRTGLRDDAVIPIVHRLRPAVVSHGIASVALTISRSASTVEDSGRRHVLDVGHAENTRRLHSCAVRSGELIVCTATVRQWRAEANFEVFCNHRDRTAKQSMSC